MKLSSIHTLNRIASRSFATVQSIQPRLPPTIPIMTTMTETTTFPTRRCLPAVMMRAGTSKGLFIHQKDLPVSQAEWAKPLLSVMGSQGNDARQLDGVGGATSTTSKVAVIAPSSRPGIDVDYTFVQVAVGQEVVDFSGNCGNIASGVGPFAVLEGLVKPKRIGDKTIDVSIYNTNTSRTLISTVHLNPDGSFQETGDCLIPGVKTPSSEVKVAFVEPAGSMTGVLFPSGQRSQILPVPQRHSPFFSVRATLVDAANPFVLVHAGSLPHYLRNCDIDSQNYLDHMEAIRRSGAVAMGLAKTIEEAAKVRGTPKLALVEPAQQGSGGFSSKKKLRVQAFSMGKPHPSLQLTGAVCIASATCIEGTVAHQVATAKDASADIELLLPTPQRTPSPASDRSGSEASSHSLEQVCIEHRAGSIDVDVDLERDYDDDKVTVNKCVVVRTARQLFKGYVFYYA